MLARLTFIFVLVTFVQLHHAAAEQLRIFAAGSLDKAFTEMIAAFPTPAGSVAQPVFGPSGLLRDKIEHGAPAEILASADMAQPRKLAAGHPDRPVILFTRNRLCALARKSVGLTPGNFLDRLLDKSVRLATSTPGADPGGDYAWVMFAQAETIHRGAQAVLQVGWRPGNAAFGPRPRCSTGRISRRPSRRDAGLLQRCCAGDPRDPWPDLGRPAARPGSRCRLRDGRTVGRSDRLTFRPVRNVRTGPGNSPEVRLRPGRDRGPSLAGQVRHVLHHRVALQPFDAALPAEAAVFDPAKGSFRA